MKAIIVKEVWGKDTYIYCCKSNEYFKVMKNNFKNDKAWEIIKIIKNIKGIATHD